MPVHHLPFARNGESRDVENADLRQVGVRQGVARNDRQAEPTGDRLLDRLVRSDRHALVELHPLARDVGVDRHAGARAGLAQQEALAREIREPWPRRRWRVGARCNDHQRVLHEGLRVDRPLQGRGAHDVQIVAPIAQPREHALAIEDLQRDLDARVALHEATERLRQEVLRRGDHRDAQPAAPQGGHVVEPRLEARPEPGHLAADLKQIAARLRQPDAAPDRFGERMPHRLGQVPDLDGYRGLGEMQRLGGARHAVVPGHRLEDLELAQGEMAEAFAEIHK